MPMLTISELERDPFLRVLLMGPPKCGKAQPLSEPVLTPRGWRPIGDLAVGDFVIGADGAPTEVIGVYPQGVKLVVRVVADDGAWALCSEDHLWTTTTRRELYRGRYYTPRVSKDRGAPRPKIPTGRVGEGSTKTAALIAETVDATHYLPRLTGPVLFDPLGPKLGRLPLDPYFMGLLLGDGSFRTASVTWVKPDEELLDAVSRFAEALGDRAVRFDSDGCPAVRITRREDDSKGRSRTRQVLDGLGLDGRRSEEKFVPEAFLFASPEERLALLRGLCDTDGHASLQPNAKSEGRDESTQAEFSTSSPWLRDNVTDLARSLGARVFVRSKETPTLPAWSLMISFPDGTCPFKLARKANAWKPERERVWRPRIEEIEPVGEAECVCISVQNEDGLYVTRGHLLTHNSSAAVATAPGPVAVLLCEADSAMRGPRRHAPNARHIAGFWRIKDWATMQSALVECANEVKAGRIKTVVVDPLSDFAAKLEEQCLKATWNEKQEPDGRRAYPEYNRRLNHLFDQLFRLQAHLIVITHYIETGGTIIGDGLDKTGTGIVPLLAGKARALVAAKFNDVIWMEIRKGERVFVTGPEGAWGPGCRSTDGTKVIPADVKKLIALFESEDDDKASPPPGATPQRTASPNGSRVSR